MFSEHPWVIHKTVKYLGLFICGNNTQAASRAKMTKWVHQNVELVQP